MARGARDYLAKPVLMHSLVHLWRHLLGKEKWRSYIAKINGGTSGLGKHRRVEEEEMIGTSTSSFPKGVIKVKEEADDDDVHGYSTHALSFPIRAGGTVQVKEEVDDDDEEERRMRGSTVSSSKKPRMSWTPELHQKFVSAVNQLGTNALPKKIVEVMRVPDLTARHVASHLQKYRKNLKKAAPPAAIASSTPLPLVVATTDEAEDSRVAATSRPGLVQRQPHPLTQIRSPTSTFPAAGMYMNQYPDLLPQPQPMSSRYYTQTTAANVLIDQTSNAAGYDRRTPVIDLDVDGTDSFSMHASASGSFQPGMDLPFAYPNHAQAISSQCNAQTLTTSVPIIDLIDLDVDDGIDSFLMHPSLVSSAPGSLALPGSDHGLWKRVEGSFYQDNQTNQGFAGQDHLVPAQYVNGGVLTDTDTYLGPSAVSDGDATLMDTDSYSKALIPLDQSSHVTDAKEVGSTSQSMATDIYDDSVEFIDDLLVGDNLVSIMLLDVLLDD